MTIIYFLVVIVLLFDVTKSLDNCHSTLLDGCFCGKVYIDHESKVEYVVNCTNTNFKNVDMLKMLPNETEMLIFTGNNIATLPWNIFGDLNNLTKLRYIDMSNNRIREIKGKTYHHCPNVETLILNHNEIKISNDGDTLYHHPRVFSNFINLQSLHLTNAFADNTGEELAQDLHDIFVSSNLTKLYKLHLEQNEIRRFKDAKVFCDLINISHLYLADNYLDGMNFDMLCLKKLTFVDMEHNNITRLKTADYDMLDRMAPPTRSINQFMIDISRNPLKCDGGLTLYEWILRTNVTVRNRDDLMCTYRGQRVSLKTLAENKHARVSKAIVILLIVLVIVLVSLMAAYAYLSKDKLGHKFAPYVDKITRKVQYTTIQSQDV